MNSKGNLTLSFPTPFLLLDFFCPKTPISSKDKCLTSQHNCQRGWKPDGTDGINQILSPTYLALLLINPYSHSFMVGMSPH
jgi:hypothetical protein